MKNLKKILLFTLFILFLFFLFYFFYYKTEKVSKTLWINPLTFNTVPDFVAYYWWFINKYWSDIDNNKLYFWIIRWYLFSEETYLKQKDILDFSNCLDWNISYSKLEDEVLLKVCKWDNIYNEEDGMNYFREKDKLIKFKNILNWKKIDCSYFLSANYEAPNYIKLNFKLVDYLSCDLTKTKDFYSINENYKKFLFSLQNKKCSSLDDKNMKSICETFIHECSSNDKNMKSICNDFNIKK